MVRLVRASHVLEHTAAPMEFLSRIANVLADDGVLMCEVPHDPKNALLLPAQIRPQDTPHLLFFSENSLCRLLEMSGLSIIATGVYGDEPETRSYQPSPLRSQIKQLLPAPIAQTIAAIRAVAYRACHVRVNCDSSSWHRNAHGSWLRVLAIKNRLHPADADPKPHKSGSGGFLDGQRCEDLTLRITSRDITSVHSCPTSVES